MIDQVRAFATPITIADLPHLAAFNGAVAAALSAEAASTPGIQRSNQGGWHSVPDLTQRGAPFAPLLEGLVEHARKTARTWAEASGQPMRHRYELQVQAWATVLGQGGHLLPHHHAESHVSGVYYVDAGDPPPPDMPNAGVLALLDPRAGVADVPGMQLYPSTVRVPPKTGLAVLFPGFLRHYVQPYLGERPRIAIAFNVRLHPQ